MVLSSMISGRTALITSVSKAKFDMEADGKVHLNPNQQKPSENCKKTIFSDQELLPPIKIQH